MKLLHQELSYKVRGCAIDVRKNYGPGHKELIYQRALAEELKSENLKFQKEKAIKIYSPKSGEVVGTYRPDFIIEDKIIVELKSLSSVPKEVVNQLYTYLRNSKFELGFLINFGGKRLTIKRVVYSNNRKAWFNRLRGPRSSPRQSASKSASIRVVGRAYKSASIRVLKGKAWKFGDDIDTDQIYPGKYLPLTDKKEMARHAMEGAENGSNFLSQVREGDIIVAGENFGCGSSREHATVAIRGCGIAVVIAKSFARIFHRNCVNTGLPFLRLKDIGQIQQGDVLEVNIENGEVRNITQNTVYRAEPVSSFELDIMKAGGLLAYLRNTE